jgi:hypothetical protein
VSVSYGDADPGEHLVSAGLSHRQIALWASRKRRLAQPDSSNLPRGTRPRLAEKPASYSRFAATPPPERLDARGRYPIGCDLATTSGQRAGSMRQPPRRAAVETAAWATKQVPLS